MDYASNPVQLTPGLQPVASGATNSSSTVSGVLNFNGLLQTASAEPFVAGTPAGVGGTAEGTGANNAAVLTLPATAKAAIAAQMATGDADLSVNTDNLANFPLSSQIAVNVQKISSTQLGTTAGGAGLISDEVEAEIDLDTLLPNGSLQAVLAGPANAQPDVDARSSNIELKSETGNTGLSVNKNLSALALATTETEVKAVSSRSVEVANAVGESAAPVAATASSAIIGGLKITREKASNPDDTKPVSGAVVTGKGLNDAAVATQAPNQNELALKTGMGTANGIQQGVNNQSDSITLGQPRTPVPMVVNTLSEQRVPLNPTVVELSSPQGNGVMVSATIASAGVGQGVISRQRNGAANDESVSQLARGGNDARLLELNGARTAGAVTQGNTVVSTAVETKSELEARHTNAVTLAAIRDDKSLRSAVTVNQTQMAARVGGVDVTHISSVDFATAQVDSTSAPQTVSRVAILEPGWTSQLGSDLRALVARGTSTTQVQVSPAELGPLDIEVSVNRQEVSVRILAMHGQTREMLEAALPRLREALGQSYTSVEVSVGNGSGNASSHGQSQHTGGQTGTMQMMSDAQDGLRDSGSTGDTGLADEVDNGEDTGDSANDGSDSPVDGLPVNNSVKPARGLVDAYA